jgi:NAD(P)-dependent dehydrogenase (short-subunit alcohol dehydrogenase family)
MDELRFDGQVAIVTGAGRGLGRAYALALAARGAKVLVNNRIRAGLENLKPVALEVAEEIAAAGGIAAANTSDLSSPAGARSIVQSALDIFGRVDIVVNNAGIVHFHSFADYPDDEFDEMLNIQFKAAWYLTQAAWPHFIAQGYGRVVNTVSRGAFFGDPHGAAYAAAKGANYSLTRALAVEGREHGIRVNAISPVAWTPLYARAPDVSEERKAELVADFRTELVAPVVLALAHESCPFTGEVIMAAGGQINRLYIAHTLGTELQGDFGPEEVLEALPEIWSEHDAFAMGLVGTGRGGGTPRTEVPPEAERP